MRWWLVVGGVVLAVVLVTFFAWRLGIGRGFVAAAQRPVPGLRVIRNMHVWMLIWAWATGVLLTLVVGAIARHDNQRQEREFTEALVMQRTQDILRNELTQEKVRQISKRTAVDIFNDCVTKEAAVTGCRKDLAAAIDKVFRVTPEGRIVAIEGGRPPAARVTIRPPGERRVVRERVIERAPGRGLKGPKGDRGPAGRDGVTKTIVKHQLDSSAVDAVDNLVHDLEATVGTLGGRVQTLEGRLGAALNRLCSLLRVCVQR